jgi:pimeloyl-ACP methyl ester carboxylesterase
MIDEHWLTINGQKIYVQHHTHPYPSEKTTLVFFHEALGSVAQWRDFPRKVGELTGFNVLIYDRLGHGQSDPMTQKRGKDYLQYEAWEMAPSVLKHFQIENPILYGHSDGGTIALLYAARFPTQALITEAAHVVVEDVTLDGIRQALLRKTFLVERLTKYHGDKAEALFDAWSETWLDSSFFGWDITDILPAIACPALIIQGQNDAYATQKQVELIKLGIGKKAHTVLIPDCGHTPHKEARAFVLEKVCAFLNTKL